MLRHLLIPALLSATLVPAASRAQSTGSTPSLSKEDEFRKVLQKIHDELTAKGFTDVKVVPGSYIVSGKDKDGNPVVMVIGPNSMTMMTGTPDDEDPSIAETPDKKDDPIRQ